MSPEITTKVCADGFVSPAGNSLCRATASDTSHPVMKRLIDDGIEITAIHNHLLGASPAVFYMHVRAHGDPVKLAATLHAGLA